MILEAECFVRPRLFLCDNPKDTLPSERNGKIMNDIMGSVKLKDKVTIGVVMTALALIIILLAALLSGLTIDNHNHRYAFSLEKGEGDSFNLVGECTVDNCENPYYRENNVSGVSLSSAISPTCCTEGKKVYTFSRGSLTVKYTETIPSIAHDYLYEYVAADGAGYILGTCRNKDCTTAQLNIPNATQPQLIESIPGTCFTPRQDTYSCFSNGEEIIFTTTVQEDKPHTLRGVPATTFADESGKYLYGTEGITVTGSPILCGQIGSGCYVCEVCKAVVTVDVYKSMHNFVYDESGLTMPTLTTEGLAVIGCRNPECTDIVKVKIPQIAVGTTYVTLIDPATEQHANIYRYKFESSTYSFTVEMEFEAGEKLQHNYTYELLPSSDADGAFGKLSLYGKCDQLGCEAPEIEEKDVETTFVDTSSCTHTGFMIWTHVKDGVEYKFVAQSNFLAPHVYTYEANNAIKPTFTETGSIELFCKTLDCSHTVTVELPKINIGVNATISEDKPLYQVLNYTYETEYNCTVTLILLVTK